MGVPCCISLFIGQKEEKWRICWLVYDHTSRKSSEKLLKSDVYLIFDRHKESSIKSDTRQKRLDQFRCSHTLSKTSPLPAKEVTLRVIETKMQLIEMAKSDLMDNLPSAPNKLVITSQQDEPEQLLHGTRTLRPDLRSTQEEADVIIPHQVSAALTDGKSSIKVLCEDTEDFVLLCHCYHSNDWQVNLYLAEFSEGKSIISIKDSVKTHNQLIPDSLSVHALTGCDSVSMMYGIGKKKAINVAKMSSLSYLRQLTANEEQYLQQSKQFIANCYGGKSESSTENRRGVTILDMNTTRQKTVLRTTTPEIIAVIKTSPCHRVRNANLTYNKTCNRTIQQQHTGNFLLPFLSYLIALIFDCPHI